MPDFATPENLEFLGMFGFIILGFGLRPLIGDWSAVLIFGSMTIIPVTEVISELHFAPLNLLQATIANYDGGQVQFWIRRDYQPVLLKPLANVEQALRTKFGLAEKELHRVPLSIEPVNYKDYGKIDHINITYWGRWEDRVKFRPRRITVMGTRFEHGNVEFPILWELETQDVRDGVRVPEFYLFATANGDKGRAVSQFEINETSMDSDTKQLVTSLQNQIAYYQAELSQLKEENISVRTTQGNWASITKGLMRRNKLGMDGVRMVFAGALADHDTIRSAFKSTFGTNRIPYLMLGALAVVAVAVLGLYGNPQAAAGLARWINQNEVFLIIVGMLIVAAIVYGGILRRR